MPRRPPVFLTILFLITVDPLQVFPQPTPYAKCKDREVLLQQACDAIRNNEKGAAIDLLKDIARHCKDIEPIVNAAQSGLDIQRAAEAIESGNNEEAIRLLDMLTFQYRNTIAPISQEAKTSIEAKKGELLKAQNEALNRKSGMARYPVVLIGVVFVLIVAAVLIYRKGYKAAGEVHRTHKLFWFWPPIIAKRQQLPTSLFLAASFTACVVIIFSWPLIYALDQQGINFFASPGVIYIVFVSLATFWSLGNTLVISTRQRSGFVRFVQFHRELKRILEDVRSRDDEKGKEEVYIIDYSANIGHVSDNETAKLIAATIGQFRSRTSCKTHLLVLPDEELEKIYESLLRRQGHEDKELLDKLMNDVEKTYEQIDRQYLAVWRSKKIHSEHYVVSANEGLQYIVIPEQDGSKNQLMGETTYDVNRIEFLRRTALDYLSEAITPAYEAGKQNPCFNVGQDNICRIDVFFAEKEEHFSRFQNIGCNPDDYEKLPRETYTALTVDDQKLVKGCEYEISSPTFQFAKVRLVKGALHNDLCSPLSNTIRLQPPPTPAVEATPQTDPASQHPAAVNGSDVAQEGLDANS